MYVKPVFAVGISLILVAILKNIECNEIANGVRKHGGRNHAGKSGLLKNFKTSQMLKKNKKARNIGKMIGYSPKLKETDTRTLAYLTLYEADLIKIAAYRQLTNLYKKETSNDGKKKLIPKIIPATTELIQYYSVVNNYPLITKTFFEGLSYANKCIGILGQKGLCYKWKTQLLASYFFSNKVIVNKSMRNWLKESSKKAKEELKNDKELMFMETRISCELGLMVQNRNAFVKKVKELYLGNNKELQNFDCVKELEQFQNDIYNVGSYKGEFYYLLSRAYAKQGQNLKALEHLKEARKGYVLDAKTRYTNVKAQELFEKLYLQEHTEL